MKYVRCFRFIFTFNSFSWIEQKKNKTWNISTWHIIKIPNTFLTLLRTQQFSWHFPDFLAKFLKFLIIPNIPDNVATLWLLIFKFLIKNSYMRHFFCFSFILTCPHDCTVFNFSDTDYIWNNTLKDIENLWGMSKWIFPPCVFLQMLKK